MKAGIGSQRDAILYCDGASSGNPGKSGIGAVLTCGDETYEISENIGIATNNIAEYTALIKGLSKAISLKIETLSIFLDSELLVRQIEGSYKVKNEKLKELYLDVISQLRAFKGYSIRHIPREQNKKADALARKAVYPVRKSG
ncbi:MAG: ribonuclease HI family protein [Thermodesulfovibrionales bacterium]|nr:ribonuclease HI family protein [Thermodesulfovibrionales bacterium]MDP3111921.1 ribonuclease HI family protein [Thermodesulfovibrionales bacterium]